MTWVASAAHALKESTKMESTPRQSKVVMAIHSGHDGHGPSGAVIEERADDPAAFTLVHLLQLPPRVPYTALAEGAAELVRTLAANGCDWRLVLGRPPGPRVSVEFIAPTLRPFIRVTEVGSGLQDATGYGGDVSAPVLAALLRDRLESGELRLAASLVNVREHVDRLLESLQGFASDGLQTPASGPEQYPEGLVIAAGLALWSLLHDAQPRAASPPALLLQRRQAANDLL